MLVVFRGWWVVLKSKITGWWAGLGFGFCITSTPCPLPLQLTLPGLYEGIF